MARHNREGRGEDQHGHEYIVAYQPDWLHQVKVGRDLESGRQSTKTLFRNPDPPERDPGRKIRTAVRAPELGIELEVALDDPRRCVRRVTIETMVAEGPEKGQAVIVVISRRRSRSRPPS